MTPCEICVRGGLDNHCYGTAGCGCGCATFAKNLAEIVAGEKIEVTFYEKEPAWGEPANGITL